MAATFLTGATGFIGAELLRRLLREPGRDVYALVRATDSAAAAQRGREILFRLFFDDEAATADGRRRVHWVVGDLRQSGLGLSPEDRERVLAECREVIHSAASTDWDRPMSVAEATNVEGVRAVAELAAELAKRPGSARLVHISTAFVAGRRNGIIRAEELAGPEGPFNNTYEATKARAERFLRERMGEVPVTVVRPSIVVGDSTTGRTFNFNVIYFPIKLLQRGLLPVVPGRRATTLDIVPVDYVCDALLELGRHSATLGRTFHLTADDDAMPLPAFIDHVVGYLRERRAGLGPGGGGEPPVRRPRMIGPLQWAVLRWWLRRTLPRLPRRQLEAFDKYLPFILSTKRFVATETREALAGRVAYPPIASYLTRVADYAVTREWGDEVSWDPALLRKLP